MRAEGLPSKSSLLPEVGEREKEKEEDWVSGSLPGSAQEQGNPFTKHTHIHGLPAVPRGRQDQVLPSRTRHAQTHRRHAHRKEERWQCVAGSIHGSWSETLAEPSFATC